MRDETKLAIFFLVLSTLIMLIYSITTWDAIPTIAYIAGWSLMYVFKDDI